MNTCRLAASVSLALIASGCAMQQPTPMALTTSEQAKLSAEHELRQMLTCERVYSSERVIETAKALNAHALLSVKDKSKYGQCQKDFDGSMSKLHACSNSNQVDLTLPSPLSVYGHDVKHVSIQWRHDEDGKYRELISTFPEIDYQSMMAKADVGPQSENNLLIRKLGRHERILRHESGATSLVCAEYKHTIPRSIAHAWHSFTYWVGSW